MVEQEHPQPVAYTHRDFIEDMKDGDTTDIHQFSADPDGEWNVPIYAAPPALEAENKLLREYHEAAEALLNGGILNATSEMFERIEAARAALKGDA